MDTNQISEGRSSCSGSPCCDKESSDGEDDYETCGSSGEKSSPMMSSGDVEDSIHVVASSSGSGDGNGDNIDYMPPEHLASDDSDTAGRYTVTASSDDSSSAVNESMAVKFPLYERMDDDSAANESSSDSDSIDPSEVAIQRAHRSSGRQDEHSIQQDLLHTGQARVRHSVFVAYSRRELGDHGKKWGHSNYVQGMMTNMSFVKRLRCVRKLDLHEGCVNALSFNQSGTWLASGSDDLKVVVWDVNTGKPYISFNTGHKSNVFQAKFMPHSNDSQVVTCSRDGQVRLSELSTTGTCRGSKRLASHNGSAHKLAVEKDSPHCLLSAGEDGLVYQIDLRQPKPIRLVSTRNGDKRLPLHSVDKHPLQDHEFLVSGKDHFVSGYAVFYRTYDKRRVRNDNISSEELIVRKYCPQVFSDSNPFKRDVTCAVYSYDGSEILATYNDDDIYLFNNKHCDNTDSVKKYTGHRNSATVKGVNFFGPHSEYVVSGSDCGNVFLWDKDSTQVLQVQKGDEGGVVNVLEPHPYYPYLAISGLDNDIKLFMPTADSPTDLSPHAELMRQNIEERETMRPEQIDGQLLWLIMQQLQRGRRRRMRAAAGLNDDDDDESEDSGSEISSSDGNEDDDESDDQGRHYPGCVTS